MAASFLRAKFRPLFIWRSGRDSNPRAIARKLISSQPRYDHFDTAAYQIVRTQIRITVSILLAFFRSAAHTRARKPLGDIAFLLLARPADVAISSQPRYDHFDTAAFRSYHVGRRPLWVWVKNRIPDIAGEIKAHIKFFSGRSVGVPEI